MRKIRKLIVGTLTILLTLVFFSFSQEAAQASTTFVDSTSGITCSNPISSTPMSNSYGTAFYVGAGATVTSIQVAVESHTVSSDVVKLFSSTGTGTNVTPSAQVATFTYSSSSGPNGSSGYYIETFVGTFNAVTGGIYYETFSSSSTSGGFCQDSTTPIYTNSWYLYLDSFDYMWTGSNNSSFNNHASHLDIIISGNLNGQIALSYSPTNSQFHHSGSAITATLVGGAGTVTFYYNNKKIFNCVNLYASGSTIACNWLASAHGLVSLTAYYTPTSSNYNATMSLPLFVTVNKRTAAYGT
jgi:hypothetical protein